MSNKLYVGNISWNANENDLSSVFEPFGEVTEVKIIFDRETNRSKGFGFVTFKNAEDAKQAMNDVNETDFMGRTIRVSIAEERRREGGGFRSQRSEDGFNSRGPRGYTR